MKVHDVLKNLRPKKAPQSERVTVQARVDPELRRRVLERAATITPKRTMEEIITAGLEAFVDGN
jgi:hypothetical protein